MNVAVKQSPDELHARLEGKPDSRKAFEWQVYARQLYAAIALMRADTLEGVASWHDEQAKNSRSTGYANCHADSAVSIRAMSIRAMKGMK